MSDFKDKRPFYKTKLEDNKRDQFTLELDLEQRKELEDIKSWLDIKSDSRAVKLCMEAGINAIKGSWKASTWRYVVSSERQRLSQYQKLDKVDSGENAMQDS